MEKCVSIIVPIYNAEKYLDDCIRTIINQSYKNIEILLIDDGSTDNSYNKCLTYAKKDERVKVIKKKNGGAGDARNYGITIAKGDYVLFVDSDDYCSLDLVEVLVLNANGDIVIGGIREFSGKELLVNHGLDRDMVISDKKYLKEILGRYGLDIFCGAPYGKLYRADIIKKNKIRFDVHSNFAEDFCFNLDYLQYVSEIAIVHNELYYYRINTPGSLSEANRKITDLNKYLRRREEVFDKLVDLYETKSVYGECKKDVDNVFKVLVRATMISICDGKWNDAKKGLKSLHDSARKYEIDYSYGQSVLNKIRFYLLLKDSRFLLYLQERLSIKVKKYV